MVHARERLPKVSGRHRRIDSIVSAVTVQGSLPQASIFGNPCSDRVFVSDKDAVDLLDGHFMAASRAMFALA